MWTCGREGRMERGICSQVVPRAEGGVVSFGVDARR